MTLDAALEIAREFNPRLRESDASFREQEARLKEIGANSLPSVDGSASYFYDDDELLETFGGSSAPNNERWAALLSVNQPLFSGGRLKATRQAERKRMLSEEQQRMQIEAEVLLGVKEAYLGALLARETIGVQAASLAVLEQQMNLAGNRVEAGSAPPFDLLQARVAYENARPPLLRAENDYRIALDGLLVEIGLPPPGDPAESELDLAPDWPAPERAVPTLSNAVQRARDHRPELKDIDHRIEAAQRDLVALGRTLRPDVDLVGQYGIQSRLFDDDGDDERKGWSTGLQATWTFWDGDINRQQGVQQRERIMQLSWQREQLWLAIDEETRVAWYNVDVAARILEANRLVVDQAEEALRMARERYEAGVLTQTDVLQSQLGLTRARLQILQAEHDLHVAHARLLKAQGLE